MLVHVDGRAVRLEYYFRIMQTVPESTENEPPIWEQGYCPVKARVWKTAQVVNANGNTGAFVRVEKAIDHPVMTIAIGSEFYWSLRDDRRRMDPAGEACAQLKSIGFFSKSAPRTGKPACAIVSIVQRPSHGTMRRLASGLVEYMPVPGFVGMDKVEFMIDAAGEKVRVIWAISVEDAEEKGEVNQSASPPARLIAP